MLALPLGSPHFIQSIPALVLEELHSNSRRYFYRLSTASQSFDFYIILYIILFVYPAGT